MNIYPKLATSRICNNAFNILLTQAIVAAIKAVNAPMKVINSRAKGAYSKRWEKRTIIKTPAVTIVAAWISADTGVGPSIASGSQVCKPDLR